MTTTPHCKLKQYCEIRKQWNIKYMTTQACGEYFMHNHALKLMAFHSRKIRRRYPKFV